MTLPVAALVRPADLRGQANGELEAHLLTPVDGGEVLHHAAAGSWMAMRQAAHGDRVSIAVGADAYRPLVTQVAIFLDRYIPVTSHRTGARWWREQWWVKKAGVDRAAVPGTSNHGWGLAVDVAACRTENTVACRWLKENAHRFGWSAEIQDEPWHWRAVHGDVVPATVVPRRRVVSPPSESPTGDDDMLVGFFRFEPRAEVYAVHSNGTKTWVPDSDALSAAQALASLAHIDPMPQPIASAALMRALGPIIGPVPTGVDPWGVSRRK